MTKDDLRDCGRTLFGERWQTALARALRVNPSTVRRWVSGAIPVPISRQVMIETLIRNRKLEAKLRALDKTY